MRVFGEGISIKEKLSIRSSRLLKLLNIINILNSIIIQLMLSTSTVLYILQFKARPD